MSKRVVMRLTDWSQDVGNVRKFLDQVEALGAGPRSKIHYAVDAGNHPCFYVVLPEKAAEALERKQKPKPPTKAQLAVEAARKAREEAVKSGAPVPGHVKPVVKNGKLVISVTLKKKRKP